MKKIILRKKRLSGNHRSHAMNAKKRMWKGNKQTSVVFIDNQPIKIIGTAREIKALRKKQSK